MNASIMFIRMGEGIHPTESHYTIWFQPVGFTYFSHMKLLVDLCLWSAAAAEFV